MVLALIRCIVPFPCYPVAAAFRPYAHTRAAYSMSTDPESRGGFGPYLRAVGPEYEDNGVVKTIRYGEISDLAHALELHGKNTAAFLVEPIQGEAG